MTNLSTVGAAAPLALDDDDVSFAIARTISVVFVGYLKEHR